MVSEEALAEVYLETMLKSPFVRISAASFLEGAIVVDRLPNPRDSMMFDELLGELGVIIEPVTSNQARIAREVHRRFARGSGHPAKLIFGDCFAYALAKDFSEPLLFVGQDFVHTDVRQALA